MIKLFLMVLGAIAVAVLGYYLYERAQYLRLAEERAKAVGERLFDVRPEAVDSSPKAE